MMTSQVEFKKTEAIKLFHLIQQLHPQNIHTLGPNDFQQMVTVWREGSVFQTSILNILNKSGKELTDEHFGNCVSEFFPETVSSCPDMVLFNQNMRDMLLASYSQKDVLYELIQEQFQPSIFDTPSLIQYQQQLLQFHMEINYALGQSFEKEIVKKLNYVLSSVYNSYELFKRVAQKQVCKYISSGFLDRIMDDLDNLNYLEDYYKCLLYLSEASKFQMVRSELHKSEFFMSKKLWERHLAKYYQLSNTTAEYLGIKCAVNAFICNFIRISPQFCDFLMETLSANTAQATQIILPANLNTQQTLTVRYNISIYSHMLQRSQQNRAKNKTTLSNANIVDIETFAMKVLSTGTALTVESAIKLLGETVKFSIGEYYNQRNIGFTIKALETQPLQLNLARAVLQVFQNSLKYGNMEVTWIFVKNDRCMKFIKSQLLIQFQGDISLHCQCLEILFHMVKPELISAFLENNFLDTLIEISRKNALLVTFISRILLRVVEVVNEKKVWNAVPAIQLLVLLAFQMEFMGSRQDLVMSSFLNGSNFPYLNKQILLNCLKVIFIISRKSVRAEKKIFEADDREGNFVMSIIKEILNLILFLKDEEFGKRLLREKIEINEDESVRLFKLLFLSGEQLLRSLRERDANIHRAIFNSRNTLLAALYAGLDLHQLQNESIPIYIEYDIRYPSRFNKSFNRLFISTVPFSSFKAYILQIFNQRRKAEQEPAVESIYFVDEMHNQDSIRVDHDFRLLVKRCLNNKQNQYRVALKIMIDNQISAQSAFNNNLTRFNNRQNYTSIRNSPHSHSHKPTTENLGRSKSPIRNIGSSYMTERSPGRVHMCENCGTVPCPNDRFCRNCNKL